MPPSSDQDNSNTSNNSPKPGKTNQKGTTAGLQLSSKNGRKNGTAKDGSSGGAILAAVTKNASKMSTTKSSSEQSHLQSPKMIPTASPPYEHPISSPLLDALSSAALDRSPSQNTNDWARGVSAFSSSPGNLINLGESPPVMSHDDRLANNYGWATREQRGIPSGHVPSASPPANRRRPLSYQLDGNYPQAVEDHRHGARRSYSQHSRYTQYPPLPHQAQAHFYGAPNADLRLSPPTAGLVPGNNGYHCGFDRLASSPSMTGTLDDVVVAGYEGGLNLFTVSRRGLSKISGLNGLRGGVFNAKVLPWTLGRGKPALIAVVIHGPVVSVGTSSRGDNDTPPSEGMSVQDESIRRSPNVHGQYIDDIEHIDYYQTSVEIYSMGTKARVATLLSLPKTRVIIPVDSPLFRTPQPVGALTIRADGGFVVVASGITGETWIFHHATEDMSADLFRCVGKVWTTVQHGMAFEPESPNAFPDDDWQPPVHPSSRKQYRAPTLAVNGRWLAYCPAAPSSQTSLRATVIGQTLTAKVPGLSSQAPPNLPVANCSVDSPAGESVLKQFVQAGTQKAIEAGNYLTQQGLNAWNNYRNKAAQVQPTTGGLPYQTQANMAQQFPPTHGLQTPAPLVAKDPGLTSILDLESLPYHASSTGSPHLLATFSVPNGCSFLSFSPNGLALFTASRKGDVQCVWDLMRIQYAKSSFLKGGLQGVGLQTPHVRQIAQFSRMTIARIVDVVWTSPHGERAAMVTEPGTIHILDLPASAFAWPPPRRIISEKSDNTSSENVGPTLTATGVATSAVSSLWAATRPLVSSRRRSSIGISARTVTAQAGHGTQAFAAGISRSVGAATGKMNEMRKAGHAKLHLPRSDSVPSTSCVVLLNGKRNDSVIVLGGGIVRIYTIKNRRADRPADKQKPSKGSKYVEFRLPSIPDLRFPPSSVGDFNQLGDLDLNAKAGNENPHSAVRSPPFAPNSHGTEPSIPQAEIESNAPYQPFHTDRRVGLHVYSSMETNLPPPSVSVLLSQPQRVLVDAKSPSSQPTPWAFGRPIHATKLDVGPPHSLDDDFDATSDSRALPSSAIERVLTVTDSTGDMEQIVITTRRRKGVSRAGTDSVDIGGEEGFFEDDCEVLDFASQRV